MPPTAIEIKARLDKAVDQEGNVLDMEAVLEIVASLEKIVMTKESLEATRIGKTINLMRKRTSNEDLSKRAKKLVKRWQTVVNNHLKKAKKPENLNGVVKRKDVEQPGSINGSKIESCPSDTESKLAIKRKRTSPDICPLRAVDFSTLNPGLSPRLVSSPKQGVSPRLGVSPKPGVSPRLGVPPKPGVSPRLGISPKQGGSPRLGISPKAGVSPRLVASPKHGVSPKHSASPRHGVSPKLKSKIDHSKTKLSGLIVGSVTSHGTLINSSLANEDLATELNCSDFLNHTHENNNEQSEYIGKRNQSIDQIEKHCNNSNKSAGTDATATNSTDTRGQEYRIVLSDFMSNGSTISLKNETTKSIDTSDINLSTENGEITPKVYTTIEPEDLTVTRKELPQHVIPPESEADGVNGVYDPKNAWCPWDVCVQQRDNEFLLLPYVILD